MPVPKSGTVRYIALVLMLVDVHDRAVLLCGSLTFLPLSFSPPPTRLVRSPRMLPDGVFLSESRA